MNPLAILAGIHVGYAWHLWEEGNRKTAVICALFGLLWLAEALFPGLIPKL